jgi:lactoylglutathione lyase
MELVHTCYRVNDLERSLAFYDALGLREVVRLPLPDGAGFMVFLGGDGDKPRLELCYEPGSGPHEPGPGYYHVGVAVEDLDEALERLAAQGITPLMAPFAPVEPPPGQPTTRITFLQDPDGYQIELLENYPF